MHGTDNGESRLLGAQRAQAPSAPGAEAAQRADQPAPRQGAGRDGTSGRRGTAASVDLQGHGSASRPGGQGRPAAGPRRVVTATLDTNVLLYASDESSRFHDRAIDVLQGLAAGPSLVYLFWPVALGYVRIATHPAIFQKPLTADEAMANVHDLLSRPHVRTCGEAD